MLKFIKKLFKINKKKESTSLYLQPVKNVADSTDCIDLKDEQKKKPGRPKSTTPAKKTTAKKVVASSVNTKSKNTIKK